MKKISQIILWIFGISITLCLLAGALALVGFLVAFCIGGETAAAICLFVHKTYFPVVIKVTTLSAGIGLLGMYLSKMQALSLGNDKESK